ncbi:MAG: PDZ domain-containing protein [Alphaproteobacteria bacterium]
MKFKNILVLTGLLLAMFGASTPTAAEPAFVGMAVQGMTDSAAAALGDNQPRGVMVQDVALGGPADKGGIRRGDIIVKFADVGTDTFEKLVAKVQKLTEGDEVPVTVIRAGEAVKLTLRAGKWHPSWQVKKAAFASIPNAGITFSSLTPKIRKNFGLRWGTLGLVVTLVDPDKKKDTHGLRRGDVVLQVNQRLVWEPRQLIEAYDEAKKNGRKFLLLLVEGTNGFRYAYVKVE